MDIIEPKQQEEKEPNDTQNQPSSDSFRNLNFLSLKGFFGIENPSVEEEEAMNWIYDKFEKAGATNMSEILIALKEIENKIGIQPLGVGRLIGIKNYLKLNAQIAELEEQKRAMERNVI